MCALWPSGCGLADLVLCINLQWTLFVACQEEDGSEYEEEDSEEEGMSWDELEKEAIRCVAFPAANP